MQAQNFCRSAMATGHLDGVDMDVEGAGELQPTVLCTAEADVELEPRSVGCTIGGAVTVGGTLGALGQNHFIAPSLFFLMFSSAVFFLLLVTH